MIEITNEQLLDALNAMRKDVCGHLHELTDRADGTDRALKTITDQVSDLTAARNTSSIRAKSISDASLEAQSRLAEEIVKNADRDRKIEETHALAAAAAETLKQQSDFMGMGKRGAVWLVSKEGRTVMAQLGAATVCVYEFLKHSGVIK